MTEAQMIIFLIVCVVFAYRLSRTYTMAREVRDAIKYPHCRHKNWHIDTQLKILWCDDCKIGNWYTVSSIEGRKVEVQL